MTVYLPLVFFLIILGVMLLRRPGREPDVSREASQQIANLSERIRTLEAIITDRDRQLRKDIDGLS
ncbi:hypothetical protein [Hyphomonas pacifica]|uniref:Uncharacterized protein n=1 Tax=Hyphomonas pacifica TaxID=1280941 RepID=A0A062TZD6_9PROT|nr:hypothetical protein [Hyphomonas pacifica]KCZ48323.1 hypothetical protein HY2_03730 [Hyphomonas pacifica]RAN31635.1 hypothetical protein HY3_03425 [Hyphomonas pacifica]RAN32026.1 hypothetical protein HY11_05490 [Hyphomonas pacifica]